MKQQKKVLSLIMSLVMLFSTLIIPSTVFASSNTVKIDILSINDFHGTLLSTSETDKNIGAAKLVEAVNARRLQNRNTLFVSAGDNFNGSSISNLLLGEPVALMLNNMNIVASAIGNHEYDWGLDMFPVWTKAMGAPFLAANIYSKDTNKPVDYALPYIIKDVSGVKVAFIGLTTPETAYKTKPENVNSVEFRNPIETAKEYVPIVKEKGADIVILLTHIGTRQNQETKNIVWETNMSGLANVKDVDGIITGHYHETVAGFTNNVPVVQAYYNGRSLGVLSFEFNKDTKKIVSATPSVDELYKRKVDLKESFGTKYNMKIYETAVAPILNEVLGQTVEKLDHNKEGNSILGQWTSEVMQKAANADIAFTNGGGLRRPLEAGVITMGDLYEVMPFDNVLSIVNLTGKQVKAVLEHGINNESIGWIQFSGLKIVCDPNAAVGQRLIEATLEDGTPIDDSKIYKVVTNDFMATGGDGYVQFLSGEKLGETVPIRDVMADAIIEQGTINYKPIERVTFK